jgi:hypothetical protein
MRVIIVLALLLVGACETQRPQSGHIQHHPATSHLVV